MLCHGRFALCGDWEAVGTPRGLHRLRLVPSFVHSNGWSRWTQAGLDALESTLQPGMTMADIGTGTGILAIAAVLLGATHVYALDVHPEAVEVATRNVVLNGMDDRITVMEGSLPPPPVDLILLSISTAFARDRAAAYQAPVVVVVHDDATWEIRA